MFRLYIPNLDTLYFFRKFSISDHHSYQIGIQFTIFGYSCPTDIHRKCREKSTDDVLNYSAHAQPRGTNNEEYYSIFHSVAQFSHLMNIDCRTCVRMRAIRCFLHIDPIRDYSRFFRIPSRTKDHMQKIEVSCKQFRIRP